MASLFRTRFSSLAARASSSPPLSAALNRRVVVAASSQNYSNTNRLPQRRNVVTLTTNITATPPTSITFTRTLQPPYHSRNPLFTSCSQQFPANMAIKVIQSYAPPLPPRPQPTAPSPSPSPSTFHPPHTHNYTRSLSFLVMAMLLCPPCFTRFAFTRFFLVHCYPRPSFHP